MKKIFLTSTCLMTLCTLCFAETKKISDPVNVTLDALETARKSADVSKHMTVSEDDWQAFVVYELRSYFDDALGYFNLSLENLFMECVEYFSVLEGVEYSDDIANYCVALATGSVGIGDNKSNDAAGQQAVAPEEPIMPPVYNSGDEVNRDKFVKTYTYKLNGDREATRVGRRAMDDVAREYSYEITRKYCPNGRLSYVSNLQQVLCNGVDILADATGVKRQELLLLLNGKAYVTNTTSSITSDGKIEAKVTVELR